MAANRKTRLYQPQDFFVEAFGLSPEASLGLVLFISAAVLLAVFWFFYSAPPKIVVMTGGPEGSIFDRNADRYAALLKRNGVKLVVLPSAGSLENLKRLANPSLRVDVGFVQGGETNGVNIDKLVSLGSLYNQPLVVFYRGVKPATLLSQFKGRRVAIGPTGSGTHALALDLLAANGIEPGGATRLVELDAEDAAKALLAGKVDAAFMMGDSASIETLRALVRAPAIHFFNFAQADAYTRRIRYLSKLYLPEGSFDLGKNIPPRDVYLIGPTVELVARENLHPAVSDLLLDAAREVHGSAGLFKNQGEFPAPQEHDFRLSADARRYYKSGRSFFYRSLPFWLASMVNRILVVFVPLVIVLIPVLRFIPVVYRWRINLKMYRWYRALIALEHDMIAHPATKDRQELLDRLGHIEASVNQMRVPAPFASQFYELRGHIGFVRGQLLK